MSEHLRPPYNSEGAVDNGDRRPSGVPLNNPSSRPMPRPYQSERDLDIELGIEVDEPKNPREDCDQTMITPRPVGEESKKGRERTGHGFAI